jgi:hypothetical protein
LINSCVCGAERDDLEWRESAEAFAEKSTADLFHHGFMRECLLAIRFLAALLHFPDNERAAYNLKRSLELCPNFLFSLVELAIIERGLDRTAMLNKLAELPDRWDWRYKLAAAQLGFQIGSPLSNSTGAICLRGQVDDNIASIVRLNLALNPGLKVFVATWDTSPKHILEELSGSGAVVLTESDPAYAGGSNKNRQIKLARACLHAAAQSNAQFVLLGRTDFALFKLELFSQLVKLLNQFPAAPGPLKQRIVISDVYTRKFHLWHPSDLLMFGTTDDLIEYWNAPFTTPDNPGLYPTEIYLASQFCERHKLPLNSEFQASREFLRDFCDSTCLPALWSLARSPIGRSAHGHSRPCA